MTTYYVQIYHCPKCDESFGHLSLSSYYLAGNADKAELRFYHSEVRASQKVDEGEMRFYQAELNHNQHKAFMICKACGQCSWKGNFTELDSIGYGEYQSLSDAGAPPLFSSVRLLSPFDCAHDELLQHYFWMTPAQEVFIRTASWEAFRRDCDQGEPLPPLQEENLQCLLPMLETLDSETLLLKADLLRVMGQFKECLTVMEQVPEEEWGEQMKKVEELAKAGSQTILKRSGRHLRRLIQPMF